MAARKGSNKDSSVRIIDSFPYNGELVIELRLRHLFPVVDEFVVTEARETHSGKPKGELFIDRYRSTFQPYLSKARQRLWCQQWKSLPGTSQTCTFGLLAKSCLARESPLANTLPTRFPLAGARCPSFLSLAGTLTCAQPGDLRLLELLSPNQPERPVHV